MNTTLFGAQPASACGAGVLAAKQPVLIVFDLDGTLTDSAHLGRVLFKRVFMEMGFGEISDALADSFNGPTADEVCRIMGIGPDRRAQYDRLIDEIEVELVHTIGRVYPGVHEMLADLSQRAHLAILTNGSAAYCAACVAHYGFAPYIELSAGYVAGVTKAARIGMWARALGAQRVIVVGDRRTDIDNARAAGAYAVGVTFGMGSREELSGADALCDTARQVTQACLRVIEET